MRVGRYNCSLRSLTNALSARVWGINSKTYWNIRFWRDWGESGGQLQSVAFAAAFITNCDSIAGSAPRTVLDFGCGTGDAAPLLHARFPDAKLFLWDFSARARTVARGRYSDIADVLDEPPDREFDVVYCSNVIEHVPDIDQFLRGLCHLSAEHLVLQAPFDERHSDGSALSLARPHGEHVRTIDSGLFSNPILRDFHWETRLLNVPTAWKRGRQIIACGARARS